MSDATLTRVRPPNVWQVLLEVAREVRRRPKLPAGETSFSLIRTHRFQRDTLALLRGLRDQHGDVFTIRLFHRKVVVMLGPAANHFITVSGAHNFSWRDGMFGEALIPVLGDGLITTDGAHHDRARRLMMPAFHARRMDAALEVITEETELALLSWHPGDTVDVYHWVRDLSLAIAMRALIGLDPHRGELGHELAEWFERALAFYGSEPPLYVLRGPGSPWSRQQAALRELDRIIYGEIDRRRRSNSESGEDIFGMLLNARAENGARLNDREVRDQLITMLFGGHDTSSSTLSFLLYELARHPDTAARLRAEQDDVLAEARPTVAEIADGLPELAMAIDETLRLYPPVWLGPRMAIKDFEFGGHQIPAGTHIVHPSFVSHRLPDVFPDPDAFIPDRFASEARASLPKGACIPFGAGQRICIGKRFGTLVVKTVATMALQRFDFEPKPGYRLQIETVPTLTPKGGLPIVLRQRSAPGHI